MVSTSSSWVWVAPVTKPTLGSRSVKQFALKVHVHLFNYAARLVHSGHTSISSPAVKLQSGFGFEPSL
jgi:hypothetical protein